MNVLDIGIVEHDSMIDLRNLAECEQFLSEFFLFRITFWKVEVRCMKCSDLLVCETVF